MSEVLRDATPAVTLDDALLSIETFPNGCNFRLIFEGRRVFLEYGCYGVHVNLVQGNERLLMHWLDPALRRELADVSPETLHTLKARKPCQQCGGFRFRDAPKP